MPHGDCYPGRCRHDRSPKGERRCPCWQTSSTPSSASTPTATPTT
jgi:transposase